MVDVGISERGVSVVMATYNGASYLEIQLQSLADQELLPSELIIGDDGSTDDTLDIIERFRKRATFPVIVLNNKDRKGYIENFLSAVNLANGPYIAFSDQDDVWYPSKLKRCLDVIERYDALLVAHSVDLIDATGRKTGVMDQGIKADRAYAACELDPWGVYFGLTEFFRKDILSIIPDNERGLDSYNFSTLLAHDRWVYFLASHFGRVCVIAEPLAGYRQHGNNVYGSISYTLVQRMMMKLSEGVPRIRQFSELAHHRREMLERHQGRSSSRYASAQAVARWIKLDDVLSARLSLYRQNRFFSRLSAILGMLKSGYYRDVARGGIGRKRFLQDVVVGVVLANAAGKERLS